MGNENLQQNTSTRAFVQTAPVNLVFVADFDKLSAFAPERYSACDV
jgi:hypothetical protein